MTEQTLYFHNPGIGDQSWIEKDKKLVQMLDLLLPQRDWVLYNRPFGLPCGGFYYKLVFKSGDAATVLQKVRALGIRESTIAALQFESS
mgnify:CR=1 FL=1